MDALVVGLKEASELLRVKTCAMSELLNSGEIPAYRDGRNWKIPKTLLQKYIEDKARAEARARREGRNNE